MRRRSFPVALVSAFALAPLACTRESPTVPSEPPAATVLFTYRSPVPLSPPPLTDPELRAAETGCVHHYAASGGVYVLQGSWSPEARFGDPAGDCHEGCTLVVTDVPVGVEQVVRMQDLNLCHVAPLDAPFAFRTLLANGVELTRVVDHPSGLRGAAFRVAGSGAVTP